MTIDINRRRGRHRVPPLLFSGSHPEAPGAPGVSPSAAPFAQELHAFASYGAPVIVR